MSELLQGFQKVLAWRPPPLRFDKATERRFARARAPARLQHFVASGMVALLVFNLYLLSDRIMVPDVFDLALRMRLYMLTPLAIMLLVLGVRFRPLVMMLPWSLVEGSVMMTGVVAALIMGVVLVESTSPHVVMYRGGLVAILIYGNLVQRFRFRYALFFSVCVMLVTVVSMWITSSRPSIYSILDAPVSMLVGVIGAYTLIMNFRIELEERRRFLRTERAAALREEIEASKYKLEALSRRDPLTGVPNRRHFDDTVQAHWVSHLASEQSVALLLIDVDHFKAYNDRYGHPTGDQCLRHVAQLLQARVTEGIGSVARWGGEEFIVVLPRTDGAQALRLGQALTEAVADLGLRHEASATGPHVTISVGAAAAIPGQVWTSPDELIAMADAALYRAKAEGRHRCVLALRDSAPPLEFRPQAEGPFQWNSR